MRNYFSNFYQDPITLGLVVLVVGLGIGLTYCFLGGQFDPPAFPPSSPASHDFFQAAIRPSGSALVPAGEAAPLLPPSIPSVFEENFVYSLSIFFFDNSSFILDLLIRLSELNPILL